MTSGAPDLVSRTALVVENLASAIAGPFSFTVGAGKCLAITGASGSGKTLLLRLIADLDPGSGSVRLGDLDRDAIPGSAWRRQCCYVAATPGFWKPTAADHVAPAQRSAARDLARTMLLDPARLDAPIDQLSTGERQRVALLRGFINEAPILLLDEPTGPLDAAATRAVTLIIADRMTRGTTVLLVTHDEAVATELASDQREMRERRLLP